MRKARWFRKPAGGEPQGFFVFSHDITEQAHAGRPSSRPEMEAIGPADRRPGPRFQQPADRHHRQPGGAAGSPPGCAEVNQFVEPALQSARRGVQLINACSPSRASNRWSRRSTSPAETSLAKLVRRSCRSRFRSPPTSARPACMPWSTRPAGSALLNFARSMRATPCRMAACLHIVARSVELSASARHLRRRPGQYVLIGWPTTAARHGRRHPGPRVRTFLHHQTPRLGGGLGLAMAYGFAKRSGGGMIQPAWRGTTVLMVLPLATPEPETDSGSGRPPCRMAANWCCSSRMTECARRPPATDRSRLPGHRSRDGQQALAMVDQIIDIAIVVSDIIMPGSQWPPAAEAVLDRRPAMRIVLMSGYTDETDTGEAGGASDLPVLAKPFARQDLARPAAGKAGRCMRTVSGMKYGTSKTIAIVEDDPDVAKIIEQVLGDFGFRTVWCRSASDLLRRLRTLSPDLCIIDLGLPGHGRHRGHATGQGAIGLRHPDPDRARPCQRPGDGPRTGRRRLHAEALRAARTGRPRAQHRPPPRKQRSTGPPDRRIQRLALQPGQQPPDLARWREHALSTAESELLKVFINNPNRILQRES